jgi:putative thioredoxin
MEVTEATFESEVVERSRATPVVVDFWADWCEPCHMLDPVLAEAVGARDGSVVLAKVDIDSNPALADRFAIRGIPAVKGFKKGRVAGEFVGVQSRQSIDAFLDALTGPSPGERLIAELGESGEFPEIIGPLAEDDHERALEWLLGEVVDADRERRQRIREVMVAVFEELGHDHPLAQQYRRRLATALY